MPKRTIIIATLGVLLLAVAAGYYVLKNVQVRKEANLPPECQGIDRNPPELTLELANCMAALSKQSDAEDTTQKDRKCAVDEDCVLVPFDCALSCPTFSVRNEFKEKYEWAYQNRCQEYRKRFPNPAGRCGNTVIPVCRQGLCATTASGWN